MRRISVAACKRYRELPARPTDRIPENEAGNAIWDVLCQCWSFNPEHRPSAQQVCHIIHTVYQTPVGIAFRVPRLVVREDTTVKDVVTHFETRDLMNYTEFLHPSVIVASVSVADTALANVFRVESLYHVPVAFKCVKHTTPYKRLKRAARELCCWASHQHEHILPLYGFSVVGEDLAMVSPWMSNGHIKDYVSRNPSCDRLALCAQLAQAIAYLHTQNVVHGDIKGPNVLISDAGTAQVTDFGVSIVDHREIEFSITSSGRGTHRWQASINHAPEILQGKSDSTKEADVYALGMTMTEIYSGKQPYDEMNLFQIVQEVINGARPPRPFMLPMDATGNTIWKLMTHCWAGNTEERPTSGEVYERLKRL
ncbi:hypothetical protein OPQ81_011090 [Rhizoctonia solani]|nr:hypothetical protein OPQ81_011090 [Rhizoctonia solani]